MASPILAIQDKNFLNSYEGDSVNMTREANGTGPFRLIQNNSSSQIQLKASPSYWGKQPAATTIEFSFMKSPLAGPSIDELETTDVTAAYSLNDALKNQVAVNNVFSESQFSTLDLVYLGFNNKIKPFDDVSVRKAVAMTLDRTKIVRTYLPSGSIIAEQIIPKGITPGWTGTQAWYSTNLNDASQLLTDAKYDINQSVTLAYLDGTKDYIQNSAAIANEIKSELAMIQIKVTLKPMNQSDFEKAMADGSEMMFLNSFQALYPDGAAFYEFPFIREASQFGTPYTEIQEGLRSAQSEITAPERQTQFDILNQKFKDLIPLVPLGNVPEWSLFRSDLANAAVNGYFQNLEDLSNSASTIRVLESNLPLSLWPADETDYDTFRITRLIYDTLVSYDFISDELKPDLADSWESNSDATVWTFTLRYNVKYSNGAVLDANDVVASFSAIWNAADSNHKGRTGEFKVFQELFGPLLNAK